MLIEFAFPPFAQLGVRGREMGRKLLKRLALARQVQNERDQLLQLTEAELKDIGVRRNEALYEGHRGSWDIPDHRLYAEKLNADPGTCSIHRNEIGEILNAKTQINGHKPV